jgi:DNA-binding MarR family transcriptional regulator
VPELPEPPAHPALELDDVVHQKTRLALLTVLDEAGQADFPYLRRLLGLTDGNLGRHLDILAGQGLIELTKGYEGRRPRTWAAITPTGERALAAEMQVLAALLGRFQGKAGDPPGRVGSAG